jgi:HD-GYP domain-containing protein (c-di-GMP phosphodiesterase class II)
MPYIELAQVQRHMTIGAPLPFHVRNADKTLLLAKGQVIENQAQLLSLMRLGALVDSTEMPAAATPRSVIEQADPKKLPAMLRNAVQLAITQLERAEPEQLAATVETLAEPLMAIAERDPDLAIFQVLRQEGNYLVQYGVNHAIHCAITALLAAARMAWSEDEIRRAFKAALTMNLSMFELQGQLATQNSAVTPAQRADIQSHPQRSRALLEAAGIQDKLWLNAVELHHLVSADAEAPGTELATLLARTDVYTAKLSARSNREALGADVAARMMFMHHRGDPATLALVKEFGLYPPGAQVQLASGEVGVVVQRGEQAHTPWVAATASAKGGVLPRPIRRNTAQRPYSVTAVLRQGLANMRFSPEQLLQACD